MSKAADLKRLIDGGIVAVLRAPNSDVLAEVCEALVAGGVEAVEITFTVPRAHKVLEQVADRLGDRILLGAGTVLDPETARTALLAGARFIVSPTLNLNVIRLCRRYSKLVIPGAFTPTEALAAWEAGADVVKIFPSDFVGPGYLKALLGPLPQLRLMPTGGVTLQTAGDFLRAGACALGVGGAMVEPRAIVARDFARIELVARQYVEAVRKARKDLGRQ
jgi:2-dehydro-3-deoxyphosphogluconate aldolase/(4S)-4-hydroxy-2-oxoglutarate aldolase